MYSYQAGAMLPGPPPKSGVTSSSKNFNLTMPYWFLNGLAGLAAVCLMRLRDYRFGRRTLLVVAALIVLALGAIIYDLN
jgi:hypothetical protein